MKNIRDVIRILDGSSTMYGKEKEILDTYNGWVESLKKGREDNIHVTTAIFREKCELVQLHMPAKFGIKLDEFQYYTYGDTAYYDSVVEVVKVMEDLVEERSSAIVSEVFVLILCDGFDNASIWNTKEHIEDLFARKEKEGWHIVVERNTPEKGIQKINEYIS